MVGVMAWLPNSSNKQNYETSNLRIANTERLLKVHYKIPYKNVQQSKLKKASVVG